MTAIRLLRAEWSYDEAEPIGRPGGFGQVFAGVDSAGHRVAVKRLHVSAEENGHRELDMASRLFGGAFQHVMPILDAGRDAQSDGYFIVMPLAETSLEDAVSTGGSLAERDGVAVLLDIALGLMELPDVVHRDLKPANVLRLDGRWRLADFGIAKFAEDSTATDTLKQFRSKEYASPEQWRGERASHASDVYSLGCIAYRLLGGRPPFEGPDFQAQHCTAEAPRLAGCDPRVDGLVSTMLRKSPEGRPSVERVAEVLRQVVETPRDVAGREGAERLRRAASEVASRRARADAEREAEAAAAERRAALAKDGVSCFRRLCDDMSARLSEVGEGIDTEREELRVFAALGDTASLELALNSTKAISSGLLPSCGWDVVLGGIISVRQKATRVPTDYEATLFFMALPSSGETYRWYEVSYRDHALMTVRRVGPFAARDMNDADLAASGGMHTVEIHYGPEPIDGEASAAFVERWFALLAAAYNSELPSV